jgi:comEA protein
VQQTHFYFFSWCVSMLSSFTKDEKKLLMLALGLFFFGSLAVPYYKQNQNASVFQAGQKQPSGKVQPAMLAAAPNSTAQSLAPVTSDGKIDLNKADAKALEALPGVGPSRANDIIEYRTRNGGFRSVDDLDSVKGFGPAMMDKVREHAFVETATRSAATPAPAAATAEAAAPIAAPGYAANVPTNSIAPHEVAQAPQSAVAFAPAPRAPIVPAQSAQAMAETAMININTATREELETLKGVGPALGQRIIDYRNQFGRFLRPEDLDKVKGIGPAVLQKNRHRLTVR